MKHTAFKAEEYDKKIRQTLPYYEDFYKQIFGYFKKQISKSRKSF